MRLGSPRKYSEVTGWGLMSQAQCPYKKRLGELAPSLGARSTEGRGGSRREGGHLQPGWKLLARNQACWRPDLGLPVSRAVVLVTAAEQRRTAVNSCPGAHGVPCCGCLHTSCPALPCPVSSTSPCPARDPKARVCFLDFVPSAQGRIPRTEWPDCSEHISRGNERFRREDSGLGKVPGAETGVVRWKM